MRKSTKNRNQAIAEAYRSGHYTLAKVGDEFGVSYATVSRAVKDYKRQVYDLTLSDRSQGLR